jgi:hypothetical protein
LYELLSKVVLVGGALSDQIMNKSAKTKSFLAAVTTRDQLLLTMMRGIAKSECIATVSIIALLSIQLISGHANADLYMFDRNVHAQVPADTLLNIFTKPFEHSVDIDADQIFPNETLKREIIGKDGSYEFAVKYGEPFLVQDSISTILLLNEAKPHVCFQLRVFRKVSLWACRLAPKRLKLRAWASFASRVLNLQDDGN